MLKYEPNISVKAVDDNSIILKDKNTWVEVEIDKLKPYCKHCKKDNCKHAYYALITPELALIERAWRDLNPRPTG